MGNFFKTFWESVTEFANYNKDVVVTDLDKKAGKKLPAEDKFHKKTSEKKNPNPISSKKETKTLFRKRENAVQRIEPVKLDKSRKKHKKHKSKSGK